MTAAVDPLSVSCPRCSAAIGAACTENGVAQRFPHGTRIRKARKGAAWGELSAPMRCACGQPLRARDGQNKTCEACR